jgi:hypothetical protein
MKKLILFAPVLLVAGTCAPFPEDYELRGWTKEELNAGPSYHQMKGAILNDVRRWRLLEAKLDEGRPSCEQISIGEDKVARCATDQETFEFYALRDDMLDQPYRVVETAYYCRKEFVYYYHYVGGPKALDVWLGPYPLRRERPQTED